VETKLTVTEAARRFSEVVNRARYRHESTLLVKNGVPVAKIVPAESPKTTAGSLLSWWRSHPRLDRSDVGRFANDISRARKKLRPPRNPWE
jgi:prevent-host-death family protein